MRIFYFSIISIISIILISAFSGNLRAKNSSSLSLEGKTLEELYAIESNVYESILDIDLSNLENLEDYVLDQLDPILESMGNINGGGGLGFTTPSLVRCSALEKKSSKLVLITMRSVFPESIDIVKPGYAAVVEIRTYDLLNSFSTIQILDAKDWIYFSLDESIELKKQRINLYLGNGNKKIGMFEFPEGVDPKVTSKGLIKLQPDLANVSSLTYSCKMN